MADCPVLCCRGQGGRRPGLTLPGGSGPGHVLNSNRQQQAAPSISYSAVKPPSVTAYTQLTLPVFPKPFPLLEDPFFLGALHM